VIGRSIPGRRAAVAAIALGLATSWAVSPADAATSPHQRWKAIYDGGQGRQDQGHIVRTSPSGDRVYVAGVSVAGSQKLVLIAYSSTGAKLWVTRYEKWPAAPRDLVVSPDGKRVYVLARADNPSTGIPDYLTLAYSQSGQLLWDERYDDPQHQQDFPAAIALSPNGSSVYVTGDSYGGRTTQCGPGFEYDQQDVVTVAYSKAGERRWVRRYDNPIHSHDNGFDIAVDPASGDVFVAAGTAPDCAAQTMVLAYHADGSPAWRHVDPTVNAVRDIGWWIAVGATGKLFVGGTQSPTDSTDRFRLAAYSRTTGERLWLRTHEDHRYATTAPITFAIGPGDRLYVGGYTGSESGVGSLWKLAAFDRYGNIKWSRTFRGPQRETNWLDQLAPSADGTIVYAGGLYDTGRIREDKAIAAFRAKDGFKLWSTVVDISLTGGLAAAPGGHRLYTTGVSWKGADFGHEEDAATRMFA
jgi:hypothetical protein